MLRPAHRFVSTQRARVLAAACLALAVCGCGREPHAANAGDPPLGEVARLARHTAELERQVELASGKEFYLLLDPATPDLTLMLKGAELRRFPVLGLQTGYPRVSWASRRSPEACMRGTALQCPHEANLPRTRMVLCMRNSKPSQHGPHLVA